MEIDQAQGLLISSYAHRMSRGKWIPYPWVMYLLRELQRALLEGGARVLVNAPPRHGKSEAVAHWLPTWYLDHFPDSRVILGSYGDALANDWGTKVRDHFLNHETTTRIRHDRHRTDDWETVDGGGMRSVGVGSAITGKGANLVIVEDPTKDWAEAMSPTSRRRLWDWFNATLYTRLEPGGSIIVVQTRWHPEDLSGYILRDHTDRWIHIRLPALAEEADPIGRQVGDPLCPQRFDAETLQKIKAAITTRIFAGLYQQRPAPEEGNAVKRDWFRLYQEPPAKFDAVLQSWDMSFKKTAHGSFVVCQVWGRAGGNYYLLDQVRGRWSFVETQKQMLVMRQRWPVAVDKLVEDAANGPAILDTLNDVVSGIIPIRAQDSKEARLAAVAGLIESGNVYLPAGREWLQDFVEEVSAFPFGSSDDQVDAMSQALGRLYSAQATFNLSVPSAGTRMNPWDFSRTG